MQQGDNYKPHPELSKVLQIYFFNFFLYFIYSLTRVFPVHIITIIVWNVAVNKWGRIIEFHFPKALCKAQFWMCSWTGVLGARSSGWLLAQVGKAVEEERSLLACCPASM